MTTEHDIASAPGPRASARRTLDVFDVMAGRTATRRFTGEPIDDATLDRLLAAMLTAPSASNKQAWVFVAVRDPVRLRRIRAFAPGVIGVPPLLLVACFDGSRAPDDHLMPEVGVLCVAMAVQNLLLAAHALGLGGCPVSSFLAEPVRRLVGLPDHVAPVLVVPIGRPDGEHQRSVRRDDSEVVRHEHW